MAGVTNSSFRRLCRGFGAGLYVSEMITARALVERNKKTLKLAGFDPDEQPRSLQRTAAGMARGRPARADAWSLPCRPTQRVRVWRMIPISSAITTRDHPRRSPS